MKKIRLAARSSPLALVQARMAAEYLGARISGAEFEIVEIKTSGDRRQDWSLEKFGGKGLFTKEIEDALLAGEADFDALCAVSGLESDELGALLIEMEMDGLVTPLAGTRYAPGTQMTG